MNCNTEEGRLSGAVRLEIVGGQGGITTGALAECFYKNGHYYLLFREEIGDDEGKDATVFSSRLKISEKEVTLRRSLPGADRNVGRTVLEMTYKKEPGSFANYPTPYGLFCFEICTDTLIVKAETEELSVHIDYRLMQEGQEVSKDSLDIRAFKSIT